MARGLQIHRLFEIIYVLLNGKTVTAAELAERFEVSRRTILRDIDTLAQAGMPVYTLPGRGGGIRIMDRFILDKTAVSDEEQNQILLALESLSSAGHKDAESVLSRLKALFNKTATGWIEVDLSNWGSGAQGQPKFETLKKAILSRRAIVFEYLGPSGDRRSRTAYPLRLAFKAKAWYLQAYCLLREDYRTFKINRMMGIRLLEQTFAGQNLTPPPIDLVKWQPGLTPLRLWFSPRAAYRVYDEFDEASVMENEDGSFTVQVDFPEDAWLYSFLLSYGTMVRVLEPKRVADRLRDEVNQVRDWMMEK